MSQQDKNVNTPVKPQKCTVACENKKTNGKPVEAWMCQACKANYALAVGPFTTLELAALQSLVDPEELLELDGLSDSAWRERIGNAVPPDAATAVAEVMGQVLLLTWSGETFSMSQTPIWVAPMVAGLMSAQGGAV